uniref:Uncharacterized protein n=1 Tax=Caenorhabditis tropicalis TaxID=1561998 RepID=A0A1I7T7L1_9PELO
MCTNTNLLLGKKSETNNYVFIPNQLPKPIQKNNLDLFITTSVLYVDYCSNYFSMILIFVMSLNRCLQFIAQSTCEFIFNGKRIIISILVGLAGAGFSTRFVIVTSRIEREYSTKLTGFLDLGKPGGQITAMSVVGEVIPFFEFYKDTVIEIWLIPLLNITNYLPEIFLPFLLLIQNISCTRHQDRVSTLVISKSPSNQEAGNRVRVKAARI